MTGNLSISSEIGRFAPDLTRLARALVEGGPGTHPGTPGDLVRQILNEPAPAMRPDDCKAWACRRLIRLNRKRRAEVLRGAAGQPPLGAAPRPPGSALAHVMFDAPGALTGLGQELREALVLVVIGGFAYAQAASILGIPETTLGSRIAEARRRLDEIMRATAQPGARRAPHLRLVK